MGLCTSHTYRPRNNQSTTHLDQKSSSSKVIDGTHRQTHRHTLIALTESRKHWYQGSTMRVRRASKTHNYTVQRLSDVVHRRWLNSAVERAAQSLRDSEWMTGDVWTTPTTMLDLYADRIASATTISRLIPGGHLRIVDFSHSALLRMLVTELSDSTARLHVLTGRQRLASMSV